MEMIDTCVITVKGKESGLGGNSRPQKDTTKPVREFLVDNGTYYTAVYQHLKECQADPKCDPQQVLDVYLARRTDPKDGMTSSSLATLAVKYLRAFPSVKADTAHEIIARSGSLDLMLKHGDEMARPIFTKGMKTALAWHRVVAGQAVSMIQASKQKPSKLAMAYAVLYDAGTEGNLETYTEAELDDLLKVAEVMTT